MFVALIGGEAQWCLAANQLYEQFRTGQIARCPCKRQLFPIWGQRQIAEFSLEIQEGLKRRRCSGRSGTATEKPPSINKEHESQCRAGEREPGPDAPVRRLRRHRRGGRLVKRCAIVVPPGVEL